MADIKFADGKATIDPDGPVRAGSPGCWTVRFVLENETLPPGAAVRISMPPGFTPPQIDDPEAPGYVRVEVGSTLAVLTLAAISGTGFDPFTGDAPDPGVMLFVERAPLKPGEAVSLIYGAGPGRAYASTFSGPAPFAVYLCADGRAYPERFFSIRSFPHLEVVSGPPHRLEVTAPSRGEAGGVLDVRAVMRDVRGNRCVAWNGWFRVESNAEGVRVPPVRRREDPGGEGVLLQVELSDGVAGPVRLRVRESETGLEGVSNPVVVGEAAPFWGDLHACLPEDGEPRSTLDFELPVGMVPTLDQTSFHFHTETHPESDLSAPGPLHYSLPDAQSDEMLSSHLLEIYSCWGNREYWGARRSDIHPQRHPERTVHAVLSQGIIAGFAAGSNSRFGVGADARRAEAGRGYPAGLTAVYADALTREALFTAMRERRCYATTGARIVLQAQVNGHGMGRIVEVDPQDRAAVQERQVAVKVYGTARVDRIEVVRNNVEVCTYRGEAEDVAFAWTDRQALSSISLPRHMGRGARTCYYFVRVIQEDGEMAWSSPVWFVLRG